MLWDEENRLQALADNGKIQHYIYDAGGNRVIKAKGDNQLVNINGVNTGGTGSADYYTMYVFPHFTVHNNKYTKHFFVGSQRILSKLGQPGLIDDIAIIEKVHGKNKIDWGIKQNNTKEHIQGHIKWVGDDGTIMTAGKSGKIPPGILKKYSNLPEDSTSNGNTEKYERNQYFFHPDHLGNTSFVTDASGEVSQHIEYLPFGEIMVDDRPVNDKNPYLYNGKELDEETGLYYYGARYYDAQVARWYGVDPMAEKYFSMSPYNYVANNPLKYIDPDGRIIDLSKLLNHDKKNKAKAEVVRKDLEAKTGLTLSINNGKLDYDSNAKINREGSSRRARRMLKKAIDSKETIEVDDIANHPKGVRGSQVSAVGENTIYYDFESVELGLNDKEAFEISKNLNPSTWGHAMTFLHETGHTGVGGSLSDGTNSPFAEGLGIMTNIGSNIKQMNVIRRQLGKEYGKRTAYQIPVSLYTIYIPMNQKSKRALSKRWLGRTPDSYIKFNIRVIGEKLGGKFISQ